MREATCSNGSGNPDRILSRGIVQGGEGIGEERASYVHTPLYKFSSRYGTRHRGYLEGSTTLMEEEQKQEPLSKEQAKENLEKAIKDILEANGFNDGLLVDWVVLTSQHTIGDNGHEHTGHFQATRDNQPMYRTLGLLTAAVTKTNARILKTELR